VKQEAKWVKRANVWLGALILACAMILSYSHTADLFRWAFYEGWLAHVGVIMVELTFFLGAMNVILSRSVGLAAGWPARMAFMFGALLVGWSNVSSGKMFFSREETAVMLGLAIPICLFLMEAIVSRALFQFRTATQPIAQVTQPITQTAQANVQAAQKSHTNERIAQTAAQTTQKPAQKAQEPAQATKQERTPLEVAAQYRTQHGELPSIRVLADMAGCSQYQARKALNKLKAVPTIRPAEGGAGS